MTYLELINTVLIRLRETQVSTNNETSYSTLIGLFVNDAKRQVEDAFNWSILNETIQIVTNSNTYSYELYEPMGGAGAGNIFRVQDVLNITSRVGMSNISFVDMNRYQNLVVPSKGIPTKYAFNGSNTNPFGSNAMVDFFPPPDGQYFIKFYLNVPQKLLVQNTDTVLVPDFLVAQNAYARALVERGEDGGLGSSEAYQLYKGMLADQIALEGTRYPENQEFLAI